MSLESWLIFILVSLVPVASPGPAIFLTIKNAIKHGAKPTLISAAGNMLGLIILGYAVSFGLGALMNTSALLFNSIKFIGAAYLIYLGIKIWRDQSIGRAQHTIDTPKISSFKLFSEGLLISLTNPKAIAVLAAIFPSFLTQPDSLALQATIFSVTYAALCYINHMILILFAEKIQAKLNTGNALIVFRRFLGSIFMGFGLILASVPR